MFCLLSHLVMFVYFVPDHLVLGHLVLGHLVLGHLVPGHLLVVFKFGLCFVGSSIINLVLNSINNKPSQFCPVFLEPFPNNNHLENLQSKVYFEFDSNICLILALFVNFAKQC